MMFEYFSSQAVSWEPWQVLYCMLIGLSGMLLALPMAKDFNFRSRWLIIPGGISVLVWLTPTGLIIVANLYYVLFFFAPIGASIIAASHAVWCFGITMYALFSGYRTRI